MTGDRRQRHLKILEIISTHAIHTQEELADALAREGWDVTQSSVSRDIAALHLVKVDGAYQRPALPAGRATIPTSSGSRKECSRSNRRARRIIVLHRREASQPSAPRSTASPGPTCCNYLRRRYDFRRGEEPAAQRRFDDGARLATSR